jgi:competence protein ComEA
LFVLSKQEKIVLLLIMSIVIAFFAWKLYLQEKNSITVMPANQENREISPIIEEAVEEEICIIHVAGAVRQPGVYQLYKGKRIIDAVKAAGEATEKANLDAVNLAAPIYDGQKIIIPYFVEVEELSNEVNRNDDLNLNYQEYFYSQNNNLININTSSARELESLDGIGPVLAERIVGYRKNNGFFDKIEGIKNVPGIGEKKFDAIKEMITVY